MKCSAFQRTHIFNEYKRQQSYCFFLLSLYIFSHKKDMIIKIYEGLNIFFMTHFLYIAINYYSRCIKFLLLWTINKVFIRKHCFHKKNSDIKHTAIKLHIGCIIYKLYVSLFLEMLTLFCFHCFPHIQVRPFRCWCHLKRHSCWCCINTPMPVVHKKHPAHSAKWLRKVIQP